MGFGWQKVGLFFNGKPLILKPGDVCLLDKDRTHEGTKATTCNYYYVHFMHGEMKLVDAREEKVAKQQFERRRKAMAKEPCEPYGSYDESEIWLPKYWHIKKVTDQIHIDELIKQAIAEDYSTFDNHKILCACRIQETLIEIARCFTIAEREKSVGGFPESYYKVQKIQEWLNVSYAAEISEERLEEEFDGNFDYMNCIFKRVTGQTIFQYLAAVRMEHARRLIAQTTMHTGVIGQEVGYPDEYYFSKVFKRNVGMPPRTYADSLSKINYKKSLKDKKCHYSPLYWNAISAIKRKSEKGEMTWEILRSKKIFIWMGNRFRSYRAQFIISESFRNTGRTDLKN